MADGAGINFGGNPTHSYVRRMRDCCPRRDVGRHTSVSGEPTGSALLQNTEDSVAPPPPHSVSLCIISVSSLYHLCITLASPLYHSVSLSPQLISLDLCAYWLLPCLALAAPRLLAAWLCVGACELGASQLVGALRTLFSSSVDQTWAADDVEYKEVLSPALSDSLFRSP